MFYNSKKFYFLVFIYIYLSANILAQSFRNFTTVTEKKNTSITCVLQAPDGELWIGTTSGLVMYNGEQFKRFSAEDGLVDNSVSALYVQSDKTLWIGGKNGKVTVYKNKKFSPFAFNDKLTEGSITAFSECDGLWIASYGLGLGFYSKNGEFKLYTTENGLNDNFIYSLYKDKKNTLWAGTDAGMLHFEVKKGEPVFSSISMKDGLPDNIVRYITGDDKGNLLVAMQDSGVCKYDGIANRFKSITNTGWNYGTVTSLCYGMSGALYIGTKQHGIVKYKEDSNGNAWLRQFDTKSGLLNNEVNSIFCDREDNTWIATSKGLSELYQSRVSTLTTRNGLLSDKILSLYIDTKRNYWVGTDKGLVKYTLQANGETTIKNYFLTDEMPEKQITCILEDESGILWLGTYGQGLYHFDPNTEKHIVISQKQGIAYDNISALTSDKNNNIWVATLGGGISQVSYDNNKLKIQNYSSLNGLQGDYIYDVFADSKNNLWIGTDGEGLTVFDGTTFRNITEQLNIKGNTVYSISEDKSGNIWFSTGDDGICKYNPVAEKKTSITRYNSKNGLRDNNTPVLASVGNQVITVHSRGADIIDATTGKVNHFSLPDIEPNLNSCYTDKDGNILIGTNSGVVIFRTAQIPSDTVTPVIQLNNIFVQSQSFPLDSVKQFSYKQNNFVFNFSTIWLRSTEKIKVRHKLEGSDSDFIETEGRSVNYPNLASGNYTFSISAANEEGIWSKPVNYSFTIATPIWLRWWFWLLLTAIVVSLIYAFIRFRLKTLQREKEILEEKVQTRTAEIRKQNEIIEAKNIELEYLSIVARETGNPIIIMDAEGHLEWVNYSFEALNGVSLQELKKLKGDTIYDISNNPDIRSIFESCIQNRNSVVYESKNINKKGTPTWESSTLTPIFDENKKLQKLVIIDTDVTERKLTEEIIRRKNKDITDSIEYAKKIQTSILPEISTIQQSLPQCFVFYLQKDIVSGDFYWYAQKGDNVIIACVDCTGHGVPGAFMSLIGYNLLNHIVNDNNIEEPAQILNELNKGVINALYRNNPNNTTKDGMDVAVCNINLKTKEVQFAGAMRPLYVFRKDDFEEVKGDKMPIGTKESEREHSIVFTNHSILADNDTTFYIFSDGYADQFGGDKGKKMMTKTFREILASVKDKPFAEQQTAIAQHHKQWKGAYEQVDDILVIGFKL